MWDWNPRSAANCCSLLPIAALWDTTIATKCSNTRLLKVGSGFMRRILPKATFLNLSEWLLKIKKGCCSVVNMTEIWSNVKYGWTIMKPEKRDIQNRRILVRLSLQELRSLRGYWFESQVFPHHFHSLLLLVLTDLKKFPRISLKGTFYC